MATRIIKRTNLGEKPIMVGFEEYRGHSQFVLRYLYTEPQTGDLLPGKNGINMPADDVLEAIELMLTEYNAKFGTTLVIADDQGNTDIDK